MTTPTSSPEVPKVDPSAPIAIEEINQEYSDSSEEMFNRKLFFVGSIFAIFVLFCIFAFSFLYLKLKPLENKTVDVSSEVIEASPEQTSEIDERQDKIIENKEISFEVLNGSGKTGEAKKAGNEISALGYKLGKVGDADGEHLGYELYLSQDLINQKEEIIKDIESRFEDVLFKGELTGEEMSARLIIGK